jgi:hypothetical protein
LKTFSEEAKTELFNAVKVLKDSCKYWSHKANLRILNKQTNKQKLIKIIGFSSLSKKLQLMASCFAFLARSVASQDPVTKHCCQGWQKPGF